MKKTYIPKMDRNSNIDNYFTNSMLPYHTTFDQQSSVKIIELDNSNTSDSDDYTTDLNQKHAWCYVDNDRVQKNKDYDYKINAKARARRRMTNRICPEVVNKTIDYIKYENNNSSPPENNNDALCNSVIIEKTLPNNPLNCFTIINNELADSNQSLSGTEDGIKIIQCGDVVLEGDNQKSIYSPETTNFNRNIDSKRTIWIYSFKNKNLLNDDGTSDNVSSEDSSSSSNENKSDYKERIATPIPSLIPRLNLYVAATLPSVTEVTEPLHITNTDNLDFDALTVVPKLYNNQFLEQTSPTLQSTAPSQNIINWMALSPRERRRKLKIPDLAEDILEKYDEKHNTLNKTIENNFPLDIDKNLTYVIRNGNEIEDNEIKLIESSNEQLEDNTIDERGDHNKIKHLKKPQLLLKKISSNKITNTIENLSGDQWIGSQNEHKDEDFNIDGRNIKERKPEDIIRCAGDRLLSKNMSLLKPVEWTQYLPITESLPSLHLSLPSDINEEKKSWFKSIIKYFQCWKMCK